MFGSSPNTFHSELCCIRKKENRHTSPTPSQPNHSGTADLDQYNVHLWYLPYLIHPGRHDCAAFSPANWAIISVCGGGGRKLSV